MINLTDDYRSKAQIAQDKLKAFKELFGFTPLIETKGGKDGPLTITFIDRQRSAQIYIETSLSDTPNDNLEIIETLINKIQDLAFLGENADYTYK